MKQFEVKIGFKDRYLKIRYETFIIEARTSISAERKATEKAAGLALYYNAESFFVESVKRIS